MTSINIWIGKDKTRCDVNICICICIWYVFVFVFVFVIRRSSVDIKIIAAAALLWCWMEPALRSQIFDIDVAFAFGDGGNMCANFICSILQFVCFWFVCLFVYTHLAYWFVHIVSLCRIPHCWLMCIFRSKPTANCMNIVYQYNVCISFWISYINTMYTISFWLGLRHKIEKGLRWRAWLEYSKPSTSSASQPRV